MSAGLLLLLLTLLPAGASYKAAEGRKQRKNHMAELKGLLPPSHTPLLVCLLLEQDMFFASGQRAAGDSQQQGLTGAGAGFSDAAQQAGEVFVRANVADVLAVVPLG